MSTVNQVVYCYYCCQQKAHAHLTPVKIMDHVTKMERDLYAAVFKQDIREIYVKNVRSINYIYLYLHIYMNRISNNCVILVALQQHANILQYIFFYCNVHYTNNCVTK